MVVNEHETTGYVLTVISLIHALLGSVISFIVITMIIHHQHKHRLKREEKVNLLLFATIYLFIFINSITFLSTNIHTLLGDVYGSDFNSSWCIFRGYFLLVMAFVLFYSFAIQVNKDEETSLKAVVEVLI